MRLGRLQKEIVEHLKENGGQAAILFGMKGVCNRFRFADKSDYMPSIERLIERGVILRLEPHFMYKLNPDKNI